MSKPEHRVNHCICATEHINNESALRHQKAGDVTLHSGNAVWVEFSYTVTGWDHSQKRVLRKSPANQGSRAVRAQDTAVSHIR